MIAFVRLVREVSLSVLMALVLFLCIDSVTARSHVEGPSMEPTLHRGQVLLISRIGISGFTREAYASTHQEAELDGEGWVPPRSAIVTFVHPNDPETMLVKRVIGLPGEQIMIDRGAVYINGRRLEEPYVVFHDSASLPRQRIPQDAIFAMGDNRPESGDSRAFGPVPRANLLGVVVLRYWPFTEFRVLMDTP
jgi:signal peptidase I